MCMKSKERDINLGKKPYFDYHLHEDMAKKNVLVRTRTKLAVQGEESKLD